MTNSELRWALLRLEAMQVLAKQIALDTAQSVSRQQAGISPLTRELMACNHARLELSRRFISEAMVMLSNAMTADALCRGSEILAHEAIHPLPFVCEFASSIEATVEG